MTRGASAAHETAQPADELRIDKWLWRARFFKTRALASKAVEAGSMRLTRNGQTSRIEKASTHVRAGDLLAFLVGPKHHSALRVVRVVAMGERRGPPAEARTMYENAADTDAA